MNEDYEIFLIIEEEKSLRKALIDVSLSSSRFFAQIDEDEEKVKTIRARDRANCIIL